MGRPGTDRADSSAQTPGNPPHLPPPGGANALDYLFLLRPMILIPVWTFFLLGARHGYSLSDDRPDTFAIITGMVSFSALLGAVYVINQISDRRTDLAGNKLFLISHSIVSLRSAWIESILLAVFSLATAYFLTNTLFFIIAAASLVLGLLYSIEPVRLKKRAVFDIAANAVGSGVLNTLVGWTSAGAPVRGYMVLLPYPLAVASVHMVTALADIEADNSAGLRTSGVLAGRTAGLWTAAGLMTAALVSAILTGNRPAFYATLFSLPLFLVAALSGKKILAADRILLPARIATLVFALTAGFFFPLFVPFLAAIILMTRMYYRRRFGVNYPSLWPGRRD